MSETTTVTTNTINDSDELDSELTLLQNRMNRDIALIDTQISELQRQRDDKDKTRRAIEAAKGVLLGNGPVDALDLSGGMA